MRNTIVITDTKYKTSYTFHFRQLANNSLLVYLYPQGDPNKKVKLCYFDFLGQYVSACYHMYWLDARKQIEQYMEYKKGSTLPDHLKVKEYNMTLVDKWLTALQGDNE